MAKSRSKTTIRFVQTQDDNAHLASIQRVLIETNNALDSIEEILVEIASKTLKGDLKNLEKAVEEVAYAVHDLSYKSTDQSSKVVSELNDMKNVLTDLMESGQTVSDKVTSESIQVLKSSFTKQHDETISALDGILNFSHQKNETLRGIHNELILSRSAREARDRLAEENRIEGLDEQKEQLNALERIEDILKRNSLGSASKSDKPNGGGLLGGLTTLGMGAIGIMVSLFKSLPKLGEILRPLGGVLGTAGGLLGRGVMFGVNILIRLFKVLPKLGEMLKPLGKILGRAGGFLGRGFMYGIGLLGRLFAFLPKIGDILKPIGKFLGKAGGSSILSIFKRFLLPINAIFSLFEGVTAFFDTQGIAEKLGKPEDVVSMIDRIANGLTGFVSKFIGNLIDPIFKFFGIDFSLEKFISGGLMGAYKFVSESIDSMSSGKFLKNFASSVSNIWSGLITGVKDTLKSIVNTIVEAITDATDAVLYWIKTQSWIPNDIRNMIPKTKREEDEEKAAEYAKQHARKETAKNSIDFARAEVKRIEQQMLIELSAANTIRDEDLRAQEKQRIVNLRGGEHQRAKERVAQYEKDLEIDIIDPTEIGTNVGEMAQVQTPPALTRAGDMSLSDQGLEFIKRREGFRANAYQDEAGVWTIGYGTTRINGKPVQPGMTITEAEAIQYARQDVKNFERVVNKNVKVGMTQNEFDALVSFAYNVGGGAFAGSALVRKMNAGDRAGAAEEFKRWKYAGGKVSQGLINRRAMETQMFAGVTDYSKLDGVSVKSVAPTASAGNVLVAGQQSQIATTQQIASAPIQAQIINNTQAPAEQISIALRNDEPSFKKVIERLALSSLGVPSSPITTA